jgi:ornithine lipid ester-linked acyl 2-hydroxylase
MTTQSSLKNWQAHYRKFLLRQGGQILLRLENYIAKASLIGNAAFFDTHTFEWIADLENHSSTIRQELDKILQHSEALPNFQDISKDQYSITQDDL